jgi:hypothetical protein
MMTIVLHSVTTAAPAFTVYEVSLNPQQKSAERNGNGTLVREPLPSKWSIQMEWEFGTPEQFYAWFNYLRTLVQENFTVNFPAPTGNIEQAVFYVSPISARMLNFSRGSAGWWKTLKCSFVEV